MGLILSCFCSNNEEENSGVSTVSETPQQTVVVAPRLGAFGDRPTSRISNASIRSSQRLLDQVPRNERPSHPSDISLTSISRQIRVIPLHMALFSHYNLSTYNTELNVSALREGTLEYEQLKYLFMKTTQTHYRVIKIEHINNMFIRLFYMLKKEEYQLLYGREKVTEDILFHGSTLDNTVNICFNNFNWRLHRQALFGKGVNFSNISNYASNYCDDSNIRMMIAAKVLICHTCDGKRNMTLPPYYDERAKIRYDTSQKKNGHVKVKFNDDEFYPEYVIFFSGKSLKKENNPTV